MADSTAGGQANAGGAGGADAQGARMREFTAQVAARLKTAPTAPAEPSRLAVRIGEARYLLDMADTGEIVATPAITPVPWTRPWFLGLANVRGRLLGVIDLPCLCGGAPLAGDQAGQLLVANESLRVNFGLLISRAFGLRNLRDLERVQDASRVEAAEATARRRPWETRRYRDSDGSVLTELDLRRLAAHEEFAAIGIHGSAAE
jgi:twitching motility protein PilI